MTDFREFASRCSNRIAGETPRRSGNVLCVEVGTTADRCTLQTPDGWPVGMVSRWLLSGGDSLALARCARFACPLFQEDQGDE